MIDLKPIPDDLLVRMIEIERAAQEGETVDAQHAHRALRELLTLTDDNNKTMMLGVDVLHIEISKLRTQNEQLRAGFGNG